MIQSGRHFAHVTTGELSWHVQNHDFEQYEFLQWLLGSKMIWWQIAWWAEARRVAGLKWCSRTIFRNHGVDRYSRKIIVASSEGLNVKVSEGRGVERFTI